MTRADSLTSPGKVPAWMRRTTWTARWAQTPAPAAGAESRSPVIGRHRPFVDRQRHRWKAVERERRSLGQRWCDCPSSNLAAAIAARRSDRTCSRACARYASVWPIRPALPRRQPTWAWGAAFIPGHRRRHRNAVTAMRFQSMALPPKRLGGLGKSWRAPMGSSSRERTGAA